MTFSQPDLFGSLVVPGGSTGTAAALRAVVLAAQNEDGEPLYLASCPVVHDGALWYAAPTTDLDAATAARNAHNAEAHPPWGSEPGNSFPTCAICGERDVEDDGDHADRTGHWPRALESGSSR